MQPKETREQIRSLNDQFRRTFTGGRVVLTSGAAALNQQQKIELVTAVRSFDQFDSNNDPHGEHDFGAVAIGTEKFFWKIDYYDLAMSQHSIDATNPEATIRVLTIMRADEY